MAAAKKRVPSSRVKLRTYTIIERAVEEGIAGGWAKAHKHTDEPRPEDLREKIREYVMLSLDEILSWEDDA